MPLKNLVNFIKSHKKLIPIVILPIILIGYLVFPKNKSIVPTETVVMGDVIKTVSVTGKVNAESSINLSFPVAGKLIYLPFKKGDTVSAYQTVAALDQRTVKKNLENALLTYSSQRNTFDQTLKNNAASNISDAASDTVKRILETNQNDLQKAVVSVELQDLVKEQSVLLTPISGIITREDVTSPGVNITTTTVFSVTDPSSLTFDMDVDEADIGNVTEGQNVKITLDAFSNDTLDQTIDKIDFVSHITTSGGNAFTAQAKLPENSKFRVGMSGNADIVIDSKYNVLTIPSTSIFEDNFVYVKNGKYFEKRKIKIGLQSDTQAEITSGLALNEEVAIDSSLVLPKMLKK